MWKLMNTILEDDVIQFEEEDLIKFEELFEGIKNSHTEAPHPIAESTEMPLLTSRYNHHENKLKEKARAAKFWLQHLDYINIFKIFIRAEKTGKWNLHLVEVSKMIYLFPSTGHVHYAKCRPFYLQNMSELETNYPWVYMSFARHEYHTVRRSDSYRAGLLSDLIIEQVLMRS